MGPLDRAPVVFACTILARPPAIAAGLTRRSRQALSASRKSRLWIPAIEGTA
jgi:hypothetical protein